MGNIFHQNMVEEDIHAIPARIYADLSARDADTDFQVTANVNKLVRIDSPVAMYWLISIGPAVWVEFTDTTTDQGIDDVLAVEEAIDGTNRFIDVLNDTEFDINSFDLTKANFTLGANINFAGELLELRTFTGNGAGAESLVSKIGLSSSGMVVTDAIGTKGLVYAADYSGLFTARSIPDVAWVQGQIGDLSENTQILFNNDDTIDGDPSLTFDGAGVVTLKQPDVNSPARINFQTAAGLNRATFGFVGDGTATPRFEFDSNEVFRGRFTNGGNFESQSHFDFQAFTGFITITSSDNELRGGVALDYSARFSRPDVSNSCKLNVNNTTPVGNRLPGGAGTALCMDVVGDDFYISTGLLDTDWTRFVTELNIGDNSNNTEIIFNDNGDLSGDPTLTFDGAGIVTLQQLNNATDAKFIFENSAGTTIGEFGLLQNGTLAPDFFVNGPIQLRINDTDALGLVFIPDNALASGEQKFVSFNDGAGFGEYFFISGDPDSREVKFKGIGAGNEFIIEGSALSLSASSDALFTFAADFLTTVSGDVLLLDLADGFIDLRSRTIATDNPVLKVRNNSGNLYTNIHTTSPLGVVTPTALGEFLLAADSGDWWKANGGGVNSWDQMATEFFVTGASSNTEILFNDSGVLTGSSTFLFEGAGHVTIQQLDVNTDAKIHFEEADGSSVFSIGITKDGTATPKVGWVTSPTNEFFGQFLAFAEFNCQLGVKIDGFNAGVTIESADNQLEARNPGIPSARFSASTIAGSSGIYINNGDPTGSLAPTAQSYLLVDLVTPDLYMSTGTGMNDWKKFAFEEDETNIYEDDGTLTATRTLTANNGAELSLLFFDPTSGDFTTAGLFNFTPASMSFGVSQGDGGGGVDSLQELRITSALMVIQDSTNSRGLEYFADYSGSFIPRSIPDVAYVDGNVFGSSDTEIIFNNSGVLVGDTDLVFDYTNTRLGIGVTSPESTLHVFASDSGATPLGNRQIITETSGGGGGIAIMGPNSAELSLVFGFPSNNQLGGIFYFPGNGMQLRTNGGNTRMELTENGNIGINEGDPLSKLELNGSLGLARLSSSGNLNSFEEVVLARVGGNEEATSAAVVAGGTGYTVNDVLTVVGGTGTATQLTVLTETGGVIDTVSVTLAGNYSVVPSNPVSVTGGTGGDDATFNLTINFVPSSTDIQILTIDIIDNRIFWVQDESGVASVANPITVKPQSGTINGEASILITVPYGGFWVRAFGGNLFAIG